MSKQHKLARKIAKKVAKKVTKKLLKTFSAYREWENLRNQSASR